MTIASHGYPMCGSRVRCRITLRRPFVPRTHADRVSILLRRLPPARCPFFVLALHERPMARRSSYHQLLFRPPHKSAQKFATLHWVAVDPMLARTVSISTVKGSGRATSAALTVPGKRSGQPGIGSTARTACVCCNRVPGAQVLGRNLSSRQAVSDRDVSGCER